MQFEFDRSKMPEVKFNEERELEDGLVVQLYKVGTWNFALGYIGDSDPDYTEANAYAFAAWYEFLKENGL